MYICVCVCVCVCAPAHSCSAGRPDRAHAPRSQLVAQLGPCHLHPRQIRLSRLWHMGVTLTGKAGQPLGAALGMVCNAYVGARGCLYTRASRSSIEHDLQCREDEGGSLTLARRCLQWQWLSGGRQICERRGVWGLACATTLPPSTSLGMHASCTLLAFSYDSWLAAA